MPGFIKACSVSEVLPGSMKQMVMGNVPVVVLNVDGEYFALSDTCTHARCSLANEGILDGAVIICGCHGAQFSASSGKVLSLPATTDLKTYEVKVEAGEVFINV